jgi:hypothetical protein
MHPCPGS